MDEAAIEAAGFAPIQPELRAIASVTTRQQLVDLFARSHGSLGLKPLIVGVDFDRNQVGRTLVSIETSGLSLGAREFYLEAAYAPVRQAQLAHVARLFRVAGFDDAEARAKNVPALETKIAGITWSATHLRDDKKKNDVMSVAELARRAPGIDWFRYLADAGGQERPLTDAMSKAYVERYVGKHARPLAREMVDNLIAAFDAPLARLEWMAPETRRGAREPLARDSLAGDPKNLENGEIYTLDHRRLVAYRGAGRNTIGVERANLRLVRDQRCKFTTANGGRSIAAVP